MKTKCRNVVIIIEHSNKSNWVLLVNCSLNSTLSEKSIVYFSFRWNDETAVCQRVMVYSQVVPFCGKILHVTNVVNKNCVLILGSRWRWEVSALLPLWPPDHTRQMLSLWSDHVRKQTSSVSLRRWTSVHFFFSRANRLKITFCVDLVTLFLHGLLSKVKKKHVFKWVFCTTWPWVKCCRMAPLRSSWGHYSLWHPPLIYIILPSV